MMWLFHRIKNKIEYIIKGEEFVMFYNETDLTRIRNYIPLLSLIMDAEDPVRLSPGVYVFSAFNPVDGLRKRYKGVILGEKIIVEDY